MNVPLFIVNYYHGVEFPFIGSRPIPRPHPIPPPLVNSLSKNAIFKDWYDKFPATADSTYIPSSLSSSASASSGKLPYTLEASTNDVIVFSWVREPGAQSPGIVGRERRNGIHPAVPQTSSSSSSQGIEKQLLFSSSSVQVQLTENRK